MSTEESDQVVQRRANLDALKQLGVDPYPKRFEGTMPISQLVAAHGAKTSEELDAPKITTRIGGRILAIRTFGKAGFLQRRPVIENLKPVAAIGKCARKVL